MTVAVQGDLFGSVRAPMLRDRKPLRPYQVEAARRIGDGWEQARTQLVVMPTGTGKTRLFSEIAKHHDGPVLVIAHRDELIDQGRRALEENCGETVSTEKAESFADDTRLVVASVQTLKGERLAGFARRHPATLVVCDEAHHAVSPSYRAVFEAFAGARVLGVTATPDRADERALGQVFENVAFVYEIQEAIRDGWLCPIRVQQVLVGAIDLSAVGTVAGDLNQGELDAVMQAEEVIHGICKPLVELAGNRSTAAFWSSVDTAHRAAEVINRYKPDTARAVDGTTDTHTRRTLLRDFDAGRFQFLCNVGVLTEGWDCPRVACVAMARPTKSRALYAQCAGRGLRPLPGKADCLLLDFVGNSGKHALVSALDVLDGKWDDEVLAEAKEIAARAPGGMLAEEAIAKAARAIEERKQREAARRFKVKAKRVEHTVINRDPFAILHLKADDPWAARFAQEVTEAQRATLTKFGVEVTPDMTKGQASRLIGACIKRREVGLASFKQVRALKKYGVEGLNFSFERARAHMDALAANGWRALAPAALAELRTRQIEREPGAEG